MNEQFNPGTGTPNYDPNMNQGMDQGMMGQGMMNQNMNQGMMNQGMPNPGMMFDPATGLPVNMGNGGKKPKKTGLIVGLSIGAVVAVAAIVVIVGILSGAFMSKKAKLARAIANTFEDGPQFFTDMDVSEIALTNEYTIEIEADIEGEELDMELRSKGAEKQISATITSSTIGDIDFIIGIDEEKISAYIPMLTSDVIQYNYQEEKTGYIVDIMGKEDLDEIDAFIRFMAQDQTKLSLDIASAITDVYDSLEIRNAEKAEFKVGGEVRSCSGYEITITVNDLLRMIDGIEDAYAEYYDEVADILELDLEEMFDDIRDDLRSASDVEVKIYLYENKLAAIIMEEDGEVVQILFKGGDNRLEDIEVVYDDGHSEETIFEWTMKNKATKQICELYINLVNETVSLEYDLKSGSFTLEYDDYYGQTFIGGKLKKNRDGIKITIDEFEIYGTSSDVKLEMTMRQGAEIKKIRGNVFDIGSASESELMKFILSMDLEGLF